MYVVEEKISICKYRMCGVIHTYICVYFLFCSYECSIVRDTKFGGWASLLCCNTLSRLDSGIRRAFKHTTDC